MRVNIAAPVTGAMLALSFLAKPALAINASDVLDKMETGERWGFISGAVDMASHLYAVAGNQAKANCAVEWLFTNEDSNREIHAFFEQYRDMDAVGLLAVLIDRHCGQ